MEKIPEKTIRRARSLRRNSTDAEALLWSRLRKRALAGHKFRRQRPIGPYVVDFICLEENLIVEVQAIWPSWIGLVDACSTWSMGIT